MDMDMMDSEAAQNSSPFSSCASAQSALENQQQHFFRPVKRIRPILQPTQQVEIENFETTDLSRTVAQKPLETQNKNKLNYFPTPEELGLRLYPYYIEFFCKPFTFLL